MITLHNITCSYGKRKILDGMDIQVRAGECLVLAGPNGSGKSTALSVMANVLRPDSGSVQVKGPVGFVPQGTGLFEDMTVKDNLRFFAGLKKCPVPNTLPFGVEKYRNSRVSQLSGGMKKQVSIACALLGEPAVILLDEPCEALDVAYREELKCMICERKAQGCAIVYVGHEPMEFASFYDRLLFFKNGYTEYTRAQLSGNPADERCLCNRFINLFKEDHYERE